MMLDQKTWMLGVVVMKDFAAAAELLPKVTRMLRRDY